MRQPHDHHGWDATWKDMVFIKLERYLLKSSGKIHKQKPPQEVKQLLGKIRLISVFVRARSFWIFFLQKKTFFCDPLSSVVVRVPINVADPRSKYVQAFGYHGAQACMSGWQRRFEAEEARPRPVRRQQAREQAAGTP